MCACCGVAGRVCGVGVALPELWRTRAPVGVEQGVDLSPCNAALGLLLIPVSVYYRYHDACHNIQLHTCFSAIWMHEVTTDKSDIEKQCALIPRLAPMLNLVHISTTLSPE